MDFVKNSVELPFAYAVCITPKTIELILPIKIFSKCFHYSTQFPSSVPLKEINIPISELQINQKISLNIHYYLIHFLILFLPNPISPSNMQQSEKESDDENSTENVFPKLGHCHYYYYVKTIRPRLHAHSLTHRKQTESSLIVL